MLKKSKGRTRPSKQSKWIKLSDFYYTKVLSPLDANQSSQDTQNVKWSQSETISKSVSQRRQMI